MRRNVMGEAQRRGGRPIQQAIAYVSFICNEVCVLVPQSSVHFKATYGDGLTAIVNGKNYHPVDQMTVETHEDDPAMTCAR